MARTGLWALAVLALLCCSRIAMADAGGQGNQKCRNDICDDHGSYPPKHFILVHGMGGGAWFWFEIMTLLEFSGFTATAVDLTANGINKANADDITTVAQYTQPLIDAIKNAPGQVILVGHSLGGGPIAYASELFPQKVSKAIYVSAVMPSYSQSILGAFPSNTLPNLINAGHLILNFAKGPTTPSSVTVNRKSLDQFYMTSTPKKYVNLAKLLMTDTPFVPGTEVLPLTQAKYGTVKRYYIRTGRDKTVPPADQDAIIAANPPTKVFCMPRGDHAVFFSMPIELYKLLTCISGQ